MKKGISKKAKLKSLKSKRELKTIKNLGSTLESHTEYPQRTDKQTTWIRNLAYNNIASIKTDTEKWVRLKPRWPFSFIHSYMRVCGGRGSNFFMIILQIYKEKKTRYKCYRRARNIIIIVVIGKAFCRSIESRHVTKKTKTNEQREENRIRLS